MKFSGVTILQGVEFSIFPIDFEWALQQCSAAALPVILKLTSSVLIITFINNVHMYICVLHFCARCAGVPFVLLIDIADRRVTIVALYHMEDVTTSLSRCR